MADRKLPPVPVYELDSYEPVEITRPVYKVTEDMVDTKIKQIVDQAPKDYEETDRQVAGPKDITKIAVHVSRDGVDVDGLCHDGQLFVLGGGTMPIGFDRAVVGIKVGEEREFDFDGPNPEDPEFKECTYHAKVKLLAIMKEKEPVLDDDWVSRKIMLCKTVDALRERTRKQLEEEAKRIEESELIERSANALIARFHGGIDDVWYESTRDDMMRTYEEQAKAQGTTLDEMIVSQGMDKEQFNMMVMLQVREMLQQGFSLDAWARHFELEATEEDIIHVADLMSNGRGKLMLDALKESGEEEQLKGLRMAALRYVANKDVLEKAIIKEA